MSGATAIGVEDLDNLRHMLGAEEFRPRTSWGFRNHFATEKPDASMERLRAAGFVIEGRTDASGLTFFHATLDGCRAVGMTAAEIKRMIADNRAARR